MGLLNGLAQAQRQEPDHPDRRIGHPESSGTPPIIWPPMPPQCMVRILAKSLPFRRPPPPRRFAASSTLIRHCESRDLNPDPFRDRNLNPTRLPVPPLSQPHGPKGLLQSFDASPSDSPRFLPTLGVRTGRGDGCHLTSSAGLGPSPRRRSRPRPVSRRVSPGLGDGGRRRRSPCPLHPRQSPSSSHTSSASM